jgi:hypothetical protein
MIVLLMASCIVTFVMMSSIMAMNATRMNADAKKMAQQFFESSVLPMTLYIADIVRRAIIFQKILNRRSFVNQTCASVLAERMHKEQPVQIARITISKSVFVQLLI